MFKPARMRRVELAVLKNDAPRAALLLALHGGFAPETTEVAPELLPELPGERYRTEYQSARARFERIVAYYDAQLTELGAEPLQPVAQSQLSELDAWLKTTWAQCSEAEERLRKQREEQRLTLQLLQSLEQFKNINIDLERLQVRDTLLDLRVGTLPAQNLKRFEESLGLAGYLAVPYFGDAELVHLLIAGVAEQAGKISRVLLAAGWRATEVPGELHGQPAAVRTRLIERLQQLQQQDAHEDQIRRAQGAEPQFRARLLDAAHTLRRAAPYVQLSALMRGRGDLIYVGGWVPAEELGHLRQALQERLDGRFVLTARDPRAEERLRVPSWVRHQRWLRPFAALVLNYGVPVYDEVDPTIPFAITFILMFGMMFGDVGQGAVIVCAGMLSGKRLAHYRPLIVALGACSMLFGALYGSVFSDDRLMPALWVSPLSDPMLMLLVSILWGIAFIVIATLLSIYNKLVEGRVREALCDGHGGAGLVAYLGLLAAVWNLFSSRTLGIVAPVAMLGGLGVLAGESWRTNAGSAVFERLLIAVVESYEVMMAYLSNTLSFLRLAAFSLNHVALSVAVFTLAGMLHGTGYWLTLVIGNLFILVLEGGIVMIQTMRLEYYEGFSRFFSGVGRPFRPLGLASGTEIAAQGQSL